MHSNVTLPLDVLLDAGCGYVFSQQENFNFLRDFFPWKYTDGPGIVIN